MTWFSTVTNLNTNNNNFRFFSFFLQHGVFGFNGKPDRD